MRSVTQQYVDETIDHMVATVAQHVRDGRTTRKDALRILGYYDLSDKLVGLMWEED